MSIQVDNLYFAFSKHKVLNGLSFEVSNGQLCAILGPNGVGKTTLFRCILGMLKKYEGSIRIDGTDARDLSAKELAERVAYIPQSHGQTFEYTVEDVVLMGTNHRVSPFAVPKAEEMEIAEQAMTRLGIMHLRKKPFGHMSGGEQQLALIARALAQGSKTLLMDEPTSSLDYGNQTRVLEQVQKLSQEGYCVLLSTHNPQHALWYADTALAIHGGVALAMGSPKEIITEALVEKLYGVDVNFYNTPSGNFIYPKGRND